MHSSRQKSAEVVNLTERLYDKNHKLYVDCSECQRGGNGKKTCSAGWKYKKPGVGGCFSGELIEGIVPRSFSEYMEAVA